MTKATEWFDQVLNSDLPAGSKLVAAVLRKHLHHEKTKCWPSLATICKLSSLGKNAVIRHIKTLEKKNFIEVSRSKGGSLNSNHYTIICNSVILEDNSIITKPRIVSKENKKNQYKNQKNINNKPDIMERLQDVSWGKHLIN